MFVALPSCGLRAIAIQRWNKEPRNVIILLNGTVARTSDLCIPMLGALPVEPSVQNQRLARA
jgi:hypothetical protein